MPVLLSPIDAFKGRTFNEITLKPKSIARQQLDLSATLTEIQELRDIETRETEARIKVRVQIESNGVAHADDQRIAREIGRSRQTLMLKLEKKYCLGKVASRDNFDFTPINGFGHFPFVCANFNTATGARMAEAVARIGGTAVIPQDMPGFKLKRTAIFLRDCNTTYWTPTIGTPETTIHEFRRALLKRAMPYAIAVDNEGYFKGVVHDSRRRYPQEPRPKLHAPNTVPTGVDEDIYAWPYVVTDPEYLVTAQEGISYADAIRLMRQKHIEVLPILDDDEKVVGALTEEWAAYGIRYKPHVNPATDEGLAWIGAISAANREPIKRAQELIDLGASGISIDTANFHFDDYLNVIRSVKDLVEKSGKKIRIIGGVVVTPERAVELALAGCDDVRIGIGASSVCITRAMTGHGDGQAYATLVCCQALREVGGFGITDAGVGFNPDKWSKALACGAAAIHIGSFTVNTYESARDLLRGRDGGLFVEHTGMASLDSTKLRSNGSENLKDRALFRSAVGARAEGVTTVKDLDPKFPSTPGKLHHVGDGVSSAALYQGARNLHEYTKTTLVDIQTEGAFKAGRPR